jgi:hypothetical protein
VKRALIIGWQAFGAMLGVAFFALGVVQLSG